MTKEEALKILKELRCRNGILAGVGDGKISAIEAYDIAIQALEKQIPKKDNLSYETGIKDALSYVLKRGEELLSSGKMTEEMILGMCLLMGIVKARLDEKE